MGGALLGSQDDRGLPRPAMFPPGALSFPSLAAAPALRFHKVKQVSDYTLLLRMKVVPR